MNVLHVFAICPHADGRMAGEVGAFLPAYANFFPNDLSLHSALSKTADLKGQRQAPLESHARLLRQ
jgi:hypothetical protein